MERDFSRYDTLLCLYRPTVPRGNPHDTDIPAPIQF
jgi:hypothetical protein